MNTKSRILAWQTMCRLEEFGVNQLIRESQASQSFLSVYLRALIKAGYVECLHPGGSRNPGKYRLIKVTGPQAPILYRDGRLEDPNLGRSKDRYFRYWQAMRILKSFSVQDIWFCAEAELLELEGSGKGSASLYVYLSALKRSGYLTGGGKNKKYQLVRDTGVLPPLFEAPKKQVFDLNDRSVYPLTGTTI